MWESSAAYMRTPAHYPNKQTTKHVTDLRQTYFKLFNLSEKKGLGKEMKQDVFSVWLTRIVMQLLKTMLVKKIVIILWQMWFRSGKLLHLKTHLWYNLSHSSAYLYSNVYYIFRSKRTIYLKWKTYSLLTISSTCSDLASYLQLWFRRCLGSQRGAGSMLRQIMWRRFWSLWSCQWHPSRI